MQSIIIGVLVVLLCITATRLFIFKKQIKNITRSLQEINTEDTNKNVTLSLPDKTIEEMVCEINNSLKIKKETATKHKEMDIELRQAIANMSHDLRTPLTSIIGYIQLLEQEVSLEEKQQYLAILKKRSHVLKDLIQSFYELSRLQANEYKLEIEKIDLGVVLCELIATFYEDFNQLELEPNIQIEEKLPQVKGDKQAINRIFTNLIQNTLKHAKGKLEITLRKEGSTIITEFSNEAPELEDADAPRIFERFFTADRMRTGQNTGLGLAIVKTLVEKQGHEIAARKEESRLIISIRWKV